MIFPISVELVHAMAVNCNDGTKEGRKERNDILDEVDNT
jgi:hypothetical protein